MLKPTGRMLADAGFKGFGACLATQTGHLQIFANFIAFEVAPPAFIMRSKVFLGVCPELLCTFLTLALTLDGIFFHTSS